MSNITHKFPNRSVKQMETTAQEKSERDTCDRINDGRFCENS